jgi:LysM repeat protein
MISSLPTVTCSGTTYTIKPTDTFKSVPIAQSVSTEELLNSNGLPYNATLFPKSGELCISNKCKTHVLAEGDTCDSIAKKASISPVQFKAWNTNINQLCRLVC